MSGRTIDEVNDAVSAVATLASDPEGAHAAEDELWLQVLRAIADGAPNARELAAAALRTEEIEFERWYA